MLWRFSPRTFFVLPACAGVLLVGACDGDPEAEAIESNGDSGGGPDARQSEPDSSTPAACATGTWDHDGNARTACTPWSSCKAGTYVTKAPSPTVDRTCAACASGSFSASDDASSCTSWKTCAAGNYVTAAGSATKDRRCAPCAEGTYSSSPNQSSCVAVGACAAGTEQTTPATPTSPAVCATCAPGTYCQGGTAPKQACATGTWDHDGNSATECVAWTTCIAGQSVSTTGTTTADRVCAGCATGTFSTTTNATSCTPWLDCAAGSYVSVPGSTTTNQTCAACAEGTYTSAPNQSTCQPAGTCAAGTEQTAPATPSSPPVCAACEPGTYCAGNTSPKVTCVGGTWDHDGSSATACAPSTDCVPGQAITTPGNATTDRTCTTCEESFSTTSNATSCTPWTRCALGSQVSALGSTITDRQCTLCPAGQTSGTENAASCFVPEPGGPCGTVGETFERACGPCGEQTATCGADRVLGSFGDCAQPPNACEPGSTENGVACGYCGTTVRTCNEQCAWTSAPCESEVTTPDRCLVGEREDRADGCPGGVTRPWTCNGTCAWEGSTMTCEAAARIITIGTAVGATLTRTIVQTSDKIKRLTASSAPCTLSTSTDSHYVYIELKNPNATETRVEVGVARATPNPNVLIAAYSALPVATDVPARRACLTGAELGCTTNSATYAACLNGAKTPKIPAGGSAWIYVGNFQGADAPLTFNFTVKVTAL